jgi:hypothetical protein
MKNNIGNYSKHAAVWDWSGYDRTEEFEFWCKMAKGYGNKVLSPMAAIGETAAYMAGKGFEVTASDMTKEMVSEGKIKYGNLDNLTFIQDDVRSFNHENKLYDFIFIGTTDLHHLSSEEDLRSALSSIHKHLENGGGLGLELWYPSEQSWGSPRRKFEPLKPMIDKNLRVWKEGQTEYDAQSKRVKISQVVYIQQGDNIEHFEHQFELQLFSREWFLETLSELGYSVKSEYGGYGFEPWNPESFKWIIEAVKE